MQSHPELLERGVNLLRLQALEALGLPAANELDEGSIGRLAGALAQLRAGLLDEAPRAAYLTDGVRSAAYSVGLAPRTLAAGLRELPFLDDTTRVLDLGAGTGAASLGAALLGARRFVLVDRAADALARAQVLVERAGACEVIARLGDWTSPSWQPTDRFDVVVLGFSLLEAAGDDPDKARRLLTRAVAALAAEGQILVVDSAQKARARVINGLRPVLLSAGLHLRAPCPHEQDCPALERERDFCHAAARWGLPPDFMRVGEKAGMHRHRLTYSFLLAGWAARDRGERVRVIGDVRHEKGRARVAVCSSGPLRELVALSRRRDVSRAMAALERGDELSLPPSTQASVRVEDAALLAPHEVRR